MHLESYFRVPTVRVMRDDGGGARIINRADFDPQRHTLAPGSDDDSTPAAPIEALPQLPRRRGRPPKNPTA